MYVFDTKISSLTKQKLTERAVLLNTVNILEPSFLSPNSISPARTSSGHFASNLRFGSAAKDLKLRHG
jgi:hypothetical protein